MSDGSFHSDARIGGILTVLVFVIVVVTDLGPRTTMYNVLQQAGPAPTSSLSQTRQMVEQTNLLWTPFVCLFGLLVFAGYKVARWAAIYQFALKAIVAIIVMQEVHSTAAFAAACGAVTRNAAIVIGINVVAALVLLTKPVVRFQLGQQARRH